MMIAENIGHPPEGNILKAGGGSEYPADVFGLGWSAGGARYSSDQEVFGLGCDGKGCCDCEKGAWGKGLGCGGDKSCSCGCSGLGDLAIGNIDVTYTLLAVGSVVALAAAGYLFYNSTQKGKFVFGTATLAILGAKGLAASIHNIIRKE
jgi:hypothetical protein